MTKKTASSGGRPPTAESTGIEYRSWLATVPEVERIRIADMLADHKLETYKDMGGFVQSIMVEVMRGNVTPAVSKELRYWAEILFTILSVEATASGRPEDATTDVITALLAVARRPAPQATYVRSERAILQGKTDVLDDGELTGLNILDRLENIG